MRLPEFPLLLAVELSPRSIALIAIAVLVLVLLLVLVLRRRPKAPPAELPPSAKKALRERRETAAERQAAAALDRARRDREEAEVRAREEKAEHHAKEQAARQQAQAEAQARIDAERRAAELADQARKAASEAERRAAEQAAAEAAAEAARRRKAEDEAARRAAYEAKKAQEAEERSRRRVEEEERKARELEEARKAGEAQAAAEAERLRRIEAESGRTLAEGLQKTRGGFIARIAELVGGTSKLDANFLAELEEILFTADIGVRTASRLVDEVRDQLERKALSDPSKVKTALRNEIEKILTLGGTYSKGGMPEPVGKPQVVMIVGVNGSGKTTTLGKLAFKERVTGRSVLLGAGDTFRAAAAEQLDVWAARAQVDIVKGPADGDPAAVCFDAVKQGVDGGRDLVLLDTAGRLHTQAPLMDELRKVKRVIDKAMPGAPHEVWLVVDGTTGQNALMQARQFHEALGITGLVLTKLDGTAKGGVVIGICDELKVPVRYVGVGEKIGDLRPFDAREFVDALFQDT